MQTAIVLLALIALGSASKNVVINGLFQNAPANQWSAQYVHIWNSDSVGINYAMLGAYFEVLVAGSDNANERLGVFYGHGNAVGRIGAIMGNSSAIGTFFVYGDAGTYNLEVVVYYGNGNIVTKALSFVIGGSQSSNREAELPADATLVEKNEDFSLYSRSCDGTNCDMSSSSGTDSFSAQAGSASWNTYYLLCGPTSITNVSPSYSMNSTGYLQSQTIFTNPGLNGTASTWLAGRAYHLDFAGSFFPASSTIWYINIIINYKKSTVANVWMNSYPVNITVAGGKRDAEERALFNSYAQQSVATEHANAATTSTSTSSNIAYAFGAAGAACGFVAAAAIAAALFTIRKNRQAAATVV